MDLVSFHRSVSGYTDPIVDFLNKGLDLYFHYFGNGGLFSILVQAFFIAAVIRTAFRVRDAVYWFGESCFNGRLSDMPLVWTERNVSFKNRDLVISGRIDEVRRTEVGDLLVGDIKTPFDHKISAEDIAELSLNRHLLSLEFPEKNVRENGYIRLVCPTTGRSKYVPIKLHDRKWFDALIERYVESRSSNEEVKGKFDVTTCSECFYASRCLGITVTSGSDAKTDFEDDFVQSTLPSAVRRHDVGARGESHYLKN